MLDDESDRASLDGGLFDPSKTATTANDQTPSTQERPQKRPFNLSNYEPDYNSTDIKRLVYNNVAKESFDYSPIQQSSIIPADLVNDVPGLLEHFRHQESENKVQLFEQMKLEQWEDAGDWFLAQFANCVKKMQENRTARRELSRTFEDAIAARMDRIERFGAALNEDKNFLRQKVDEALKGTPQRKRG